MGTVFLVLCLVLLPDLTELEQGMHLPSEQSSVDLGRAIETCVIFVMLLLV